MKLTREILGFEYNQQKMSIASIAQKYGISRQTVFRAMIKYNIKRRTRSEAHEIAIEQKRFNVPTKGVERTKEDKDKISNGMKKHWEQRKTK